MFIINSKCLLCDDGLSPGSCCEITELEWHLYIQEDCTCPDQRQMSDWLCIMIMRDQGMLIFGDRVISPYLAWMFIFQLLHSSKILTIQQGITRGVSSIGNPFRPQQCFPR